MNATTRPTIKVRKPRLHRVPAEYCGGYTFTLQDAYGPRKYMVRRHLSHPEWGWNVYAESRLDAYRWTLVIDQMSSMDYALRVAVADALERGDHIILASEVEWEA